MKTWTVTYTNEIEAETPLEAAKMMYESLKKDESVGKVFVVNHESQAIDYSIDLDEPDEDAVLEFKQ